MRLIIISLVSLWAVGCVIVTDTKPFPEKDAGTDSGGVLLGATVSGTWTVNNAAPTATSCADITHIQIALLQTGATPLRLPSLRFPCTQGSFTRIGAPVGAFQTQWEAVRLDGSVSGMSTPEDLVLAQGVNATLRTINFTVEPPPTNLRFDLTFRDTSGTTAPSGQCMHAGVSRFTFRLLRASDSTVIAASSPVYQSCTATTASATFGTEHNIVAGVAYRFELEAEDSSMNQKWVARCNATPIAMQTVATPCVANFFDPRGGDLSVQGRWTIAGAPPTTVTCGRIANIQLVLLQDAAGTQAFVSPTFKFRCDAGGFDTKSPTRTALLKFGTYYTRYRALAADGTNIGESTIAGPYDGLSPRDHLFVTDMPSFVP